MGWPDYESFYREGVVPHFEELRFSADFQKELIEGLHGEHFDSCLRVSPYGIFSWHAPLESRLDPDRTAAAIQSLRAPVCWPQTLALPVPADLILAIQDYDCHLEAAHPFYARMFEFWEQQQVNPVDWKGFSPFKQVTPVELRIYDSRNHPPLTEAVGVSLLSWSQSANEVQSVGLAYLKAYLFQGSGQLLVHFWERSTEVIKEAVVAPIFEQWLADLPRGAEPDRRQRLGQACGTALGRVLQLMQQVRDAAGNLPTVREYSGAAESE